MLKGIKLEVKESEFVSIMGPSGSGKSTLLSIIGLLDAPSAGSYKLNDKSVLDLKEKELVDYHRHFMGFIFQAYQRNDNGNLKTLNEEGMTIIQVTHNEKFSGYGKRIIRLEDGYIRSDEND